MYHVTPISKNAKTGPIPVTTSTKATCPNTCPLKGNGCYAESGPLNIHWREVTSGNRGTEWSEFIDTVKSFRKGTLWRHNQAGDLPHNNGNLDEKACIDLAKANAYKGKKGFTYTHHDPDKGNNGAIIAAMNMQGMAVNLSANTYKQALEYKAKGIAPVVTLMPASYDKAKHHDKVNGVDIIQCPATYRDVSCADCGLCAMIEREFIIGFPAHGRSKRKADMVAKG